MQFLHTYPLIIPFIAIILAEALKAIVDIIRKRKKVRFVNPGGMPSGHSAFVTALVVTVAYRDGIGSTMFMISAVIALIVMYDAITLRQEAGLHAKVLNKLKSGSKLEESLGHTFWEVTVGAVFGALVAFVLLNI
jgi:acid phosphatase family membrane protein YuiD